MTLYHGTRAAFRRGGLLLPNAETGVAPNHEVSSWPGRSRWVYVTTDREQAVEFARTARGRGRPRVLEVTPLDVLEPDPANDLVDSFRCRSAVVDRIEILEEEDGIVVAPDGEILRTTSPAWASRSRRSRI